ncbi:hypothetical protein [Paenibacillus durus]|uniref:PEP-utilising enzyme C-terminal domain-containing protein n=2 Tax=Paenibacillus durus TaxID=44251 RepID=A0A0F7FDA9_PAEDU|nr:hypothetical protein [Paenibacillus durus]AKG36382.1 hypothetical protein VK70_19040 [Paenibacillus durus ATCC 35681]
MRDKLGQDNVRTGREYPFTSGTAAEKPADTESPYLHDSSRALRPVFLVLPEGRENRPSVREPGTAAAGPCLVRSEDWLKQADPLFTAWLATGDGPEADLALRRIYYRLRDEASALLGSADGEWAAVSLPAVPELDSRPDRLAELQDILLEALFNALAERQREGGDCRLDLLAPHPASAHEFAAAREFIETVAEQTLGHRFAAACRIGALFAPDISPAAAEEIGRIADFLVLDGAADGSAPEESAAADLVSAAESILAAVRGVKPAAVVFAAGGSAAAALADLYRIGLNGIFCGAEHRTEALLRAACLVWMDRHESADTATGWL